MHPIRWMCSFFCVAFCRACVRETTCVCVYFYILYEVGNRMNTASKHGWVLRQYFSSISTRTVCSAHNNVFFLLSTSTMAWYFFFSFRAHTVAPQNVLSLLDLSNSLSQRETIMWKKWEERNRERKKKPRTKRRTSAM